MVKDNKVLSNKKTSEETFVAFERNIYNTEDIHGKREKDQIGFLKVFINRNNRQGKRTLSRKTLLKN